MSIFDTAYEGAGQHANYAGFGVQFGMANVSVIANLITGGVCHRFPDLKFVSVESGIGWIPFALDHLDWQWKNCGVPQEHPEYDLLPSEYFKRQMYGCFWFEDDTVKAAIDQWAPDWILYESDFPHPTSMAPGPATAAVEPRQYIADDARRSARGRAAQDPPRQRRQALPPGLMLSHRVKGEFEGMADDYASVDVDLGMVAPATEHWKEIDALREAHRYFRNTNGQATGC